jgi:predicted dehydrogenase
MPSFVGYNYRFLPGVAAATRALESGRIGRLRTLDMLLGHGGHPRSAEGWKLQPERAGGGVILDPGVHLLDILLRLAPDARCTAVAATRGFWKTGIEEDAVAMFEADRLIATVRVSHIRWFNTFRIELVGEDGYAVVDGRGGNYGSQTIRTGARWAWDSADGLSQQETESATDFGSENRSLEDEVEAVVRRWLGRDAGEIEPASPADAVAVAELCDELYAKLADGDPALRL